MNYQTPNDSLEPRTILLSFYQKVQELSLHELKPTEKVIIFSQDKQIIEQEDTRIAFIQAVEILLFSAEPYFDKVMQEIYKKKINVLGGLAYEIEELIDDKRFKETYDKAKEEQQNYLITFYQLRTAKLLFKELTMCLKRQDFIKGVAYDEGDELEGGQ